MLTRLSSVSPSDTWTERAPDVVVVPHHVDALRVRQVAVLYEQAQDAAAAELKLLPDDALQVGHHAARVQVHEQPAHAAPHDGRGRVVKKQAEANKLVAVRSHDAKTFYSCAPWLTQPQLPLEPFKIRLHLSHTAP